MARFLIVGAGEQATALAVALERDGHVTRVAEAERRLGALLAALDHVAIVCWLEAETSPARFLAGAIDSSMRGFAYQPGRRQSRELLETAALNSIPTAPLPVYSGDLSAWLSGARETIGALLDGRYAGAYT